MSKAMMIGLYPLGKTTKESNDKTLSMSAHFAILDRQGIRLQALLFAAGESAGWPYIKQRHGVA